jgi:hypothetical protein
VCVCVCVRACVRICGCARVFIPIRAGSGAKPHSP